MSNTQLLRRRIKSISNTRQITKAMELVAASKMRKAQTQVLASRPYNSSLNNLIMNIYNKIDRNLHPLLQIPESGRRNVGIILIAPSRGLAGSLVNNLMRATLQFMSSINSDNDNRGNQHKAKDESFSIGIVTVEKKARDFAQKIHTNIIADFQKIESPPSIRDTNPIAHIIIDGYKNGTLTEIYLAYAHYINTVSQKPTIKKILPIEHENGNAEKVENHDINSELEKAAEFSFEPNPDDILDILLPRYIEMEVYQAVLEATASEHSARMVAMKNASDNAKELINDLQLTYNSTRQAAITQELAEVSAGANALQ